MSYIYVDFQKEEGFFCLIILFLFPQLSKANTDGDQLEPKMTLHPLPDEELHNWCGRIENVKVFFFYYYFYHIWTGQ